ncbi:MAG: hypothetical protein RLZZ458_1207 [Planctomycetota bacterium]|jgi:hypothetical protein
MIEASLIRRAIFLFPLFEKQESGILWIEEVQPTVPTGQQSLNL